MKYKPHDHEDSIAGGWDVTRDDVCPRRNRMNWSAAEAHIIAFALNAVASGDVVVAMSQATLGVIQAAGHNVTKYDGPTEGVAA
ncbi:MAG: hypothetical protein ACHQX3_06565 [Nitrospirales bacterium]